MQAVKQSRSSARKQRIIDAARQILPVHGRDTTLRQIAQEAGMEVSSIYYYFKSVTEIINEILEDTGKYQILFSEADHLDPLVVLETSIKNLLYYYYDNHVMLEIIYPQAFPIFRTPEYRDDSVEVNRFLDGYWKVNSAMISIIAKAVEGRGESELRDPELLLQLLRGAIVGFLSLWKTKSPSREDIPALARAIMRMVVPDRTS